MSYIEVSNLNKIYGTGDNEIKACDDISFSIEKQEFVIILGPSGAGKTTLLNILGGMDSASEGSLLIDGNDIAKMNERELTEYRRDDVGFVFQSYNLVQNLTALENVELASQIKSNAKNPADVLANVGLQNRMDNFPAQLSGGEQQRVAIARAVAKNPKLLLCDEPTGALDTFTGKQVLSLLKKCQEEMGMTVLLITHNSSFASVGDKVIRLKNGGIESITKNDSVKDISELEW